MNEVLPSTPVFAPHLHPDPRLSPSRSGPFGNNTMSARKRKAEDDAERSDRMSASPSNSPGIPSRHLPHQRTPKRVRTNLSGRPLALPRLLETFGASELRGLLRSICDRHPEIGAEVVSTAPRPSVTATLNVLSNYENSLVAALPYGNRPSSDYAYNRVKQHLTELIDALRDYTPHFLPPNEVQPATSLSYLDGATEIIHRIPNWDTYQHNRYKHEAYEEMAKAWALVLQEAVKRGGGIQLQYGGWDEKIRRHNQESGGRMQEAVEALNSSLLGSDSETPGPALAGEQSLIRQQLLAGTYGAHLPVRVGPW